MTDVTDVTAEIDQATDTVDEPTRLKGAALLEKEGDVAADYLEGLLDIADLDGDIDIDVEGNRAMVSVVEASPGELAAPRRPGRPGARRPAGADPAGGDPRDR